MYEEVKQTTYNFSNFLHKDFINTLHRLEKSHCLILSCMALLTSLLLKKKFERDSGKK